MGQHIWRSVQRWQKDDLMAYAVIDTSDVDEDAVQFMMELIVDVLEEGQDEGVSREEAIMAMGRLISMLLNDDEKVGTLN